MRREITMRDVVPGIACKPVIITSYEIVMNDRKYMQLYPWKYIIVDEGHRLKNFQCKLVRSVQEKYSLDGVGSQLSSQYLSQYVVTTFCDV